MNLLFNKKTRAVNRSLKEELLSNIEKGRKWKEFKKRYSPSQLYKTFPVASLWWAWYSLLKAMNSFASVLSQNQLFIPAESSSTKPHLSVLSSLLKYFDYFVMPIYHIVVLQILPIIFYLLNKFLKRYVLLFHLIYIYGIWQLILPELN